MAGPPLVAERQHATAVAISAPHSGTEGRIRSTSWQRGRSSMAVESIFYSVSGLSCRGALIWDEAVKTPRPLLLMAPNWRGVIKPAIETGHMLAQGGYVVFVADMFGEGNGP